MSEVEIMPQIVMPSDNGIDRMLKPPKVVFMDATSTMGILYFDIMRELRTAHGTRFVIMSSYQKYTQNYLDHMSDQDMVTNPLETDVFTKKETRSAQDIMKAARANEVKYGITYLRDIIQSDRRLSTRFNPSTLDNIHASHRAIDLTRVCDEINRFFKYYAMVYSEQRVDLVIIRPDSLEGAVAVHVAKHMGIPTTFMAAANYKSYLTWLCGPYMSGAFFKEKMDDVTPEQAASFEKLGDLVPEHAANTVKNASALGTWSDLYRKIYVITRDRIGFWLHDISEMKFKSNNRLGFFPLLKFNVKQFLTARVLKKISTHKVSDIVHEPFILYMLQVEPEYSTLCLAREFAFVEAIIYQMSMCMPAGHKLVVKEHAPNVGNRPVEFYKRISRLPNVQLAHFGLPGLELVDKASAVATISGSVGKQSTRLGKPAIIFSTHVDYTHMPNVRVVTSFYDLPEVLNWAVQERAEDEIESWKKEGNRFYAAVVNNSFNAPDARIFKVSTGDPLKVTNGGEDSPGKIAVNQLIGMYDWLLRNGTPT